VKKLIASLFILLSFVLGAQTFPWAKSTIGTSYDYGTSVSSSPSGDVFITGRFNSSTLTFGSTTLTNTSNFNTDIFLAKYDINGNALWAKNAIGLSDDRSFTTNVDGSGNVLICGDFQSDTIKFDTTTLINTGVGGTVTISNGFFAKYNSNGNVIFSKRIGGDGNDWCISASTDLSGNIFVTGLFGSSSLAFGTTTLTNTGSIFISKYDSNGNPIWAKNSIGTGVDFANGITTDSGGNVFVTGSFQGPTITFGTTTLTNSGLNRDIFLIKYDQNGNVLWAKNTGSSANNSASSISLDPSGNILITGEFSSPTITFGTYTLTNSGLLDVFLAKYDTNGNVIWAKSMGGAGNDEGNSVKTNTNSVFLTGTFKSSSITFDTKTLIFPSGAIDPIFIAQYDLNGNVICASTLPSGGNGFVGVSADNFNNAYLASTFQANPFIVGSNTLALTGSSNVFVAKFNCTTTDVNSITKRIDKIQVSPNPNNGSFKLQIDSEIKEGEIILLNLLGQIVHEQKIIKGENNIQTNEFAKGLYNYLLLENKTQLQSGKIAIEYTQTHNHL